LIHEKEKEQENNKKQSEILKRNYHSTLNLEKRMKTKTSNIA
jgi:hypothetical protein